MEELKKDNKNNTKLYKQIRKQTRKKAISGINKKKWQKYLKNMEISDEAVDKTSGAFQFLKTKFPRLSEAKIKEGVFLGPQIRQLFQDSTFIEHLNRKEKRAWLAFQNVCKNFLGNHKSEDYVAHVEELLLAYQDIGCNMQQIFERGKKTIRSPDIKKISEESEGKTSRTEGGRKEMEELKELMREMMKQMEKNMQEIRQEIKEMKKK
ncbi:hypothetical protein RN001_016038 [Aquatica leii]|uniref:Uncharacterized protein n=1 Tax=Aquatica leii TaxID=1421715 RepID=A0AAN7NXH7_9COLE|nr:hypothetical protein RN001_016038 [Aquatica leii]